MRLECSLVSEFLHSAQPLQFAAETPSRQHTFTNIVVKIVWSSNYRINYGCNKSIFLLNTFLAV